MSDILNKNAYITITISWFILPILCTAQHYLTTDLIQETNNPIEIFVFDWGTDFKGEESSSAFYVLYGFSECKNITSSITEYSWSAHDSILNISFSHLHSYMGNEFSSYLFHTPFLEDKTSIIYHSIISKEVLKNSFIGILNDETYRDKEYTELVFLAEDWLIYTFSNYVVNNIHLIVSTTFVVPENTPMEEILEIAHMIDSHIQIKVL